MQEPTQTGGVEMLQRQEEQVTKEKGEGAPRKADSDQGSSALWEIQMQVANRHQLFSFPSGPVLPHNKFIRNSSWKTDVVAQSAHHLLLGSPI